MRNPFSVLQNLIFSINEARICDKTPIIDRTLVSGDSEFKVAEFGQRFKIVKDDFGFKLAIFVKSWMPMFDVRLTKEGGIVSTEPILLALMLEAPKDIRENTRPDMLLKAATDTIEMVHNYSHVPKAEKIDFLVQKFLENVVDANQQYESINA